MKSELFCVKKRWQKMKASRPWIVMCVNETSVYLLSVLGDLTKENGGRELVCGRNEVVDVKKLVVLRTPKPFCVRWDQRTSSALVRWFNRPNTLALVRWFNTTLVVCDDFVSHAMPCTSAQEFRRRGIALSCRARPIIPVPSFFKL